MCSELICVPLKSTRGHPAPIVRLRKVGPSGGGEAREWSLSRGQGLGKGPQRPRAVSPPHRDARRTRPSATWKRPLQNLALLQQGPDSWARTTGKACVVRGSLRQQPSRVKATQVRPCSESVSDCPCSSERSLPVLCVSRAEFPSRCSCTRFCPHACALLPSVFGGYVVRCVCVEHISFPSGLAS